VKANLHFYSPKLYFLPNMQMSKNTFPRGGGKGVWSELLDSRQTSKWYVLLRNARNGKAKPHSLGLVGLTGLEPVTLRLSSACSNQLSYRPIGPVTTVSTWLLPKLWPAKLDFPGPMTRKISLEVRGLEPLTYSLQSYRSTN
jgi:hypothetical protein